MFIRPDSPLKPFSGRLLNIDSINLRALDHGLYYEDDTLPIVPCPPVTVDEEWRFVAANGQVVTGSEYDTIGRKEGRVMSKGDEWYFAQIIADKLPSPDPVYALDVCRSEGELFLLELNPFSGADLYACDRLSTCRIKNHQGNGPSS